MRELLKRRLQEGREQESRKEMTRRAEKVVQRVREAFTKFETELEPMIERASHGLLPEANMLIEYNANCVAKSCDFSKTIEEVVNDCFPCEKWSFPCCKA